MRAAVVEGPGKIVVRDLPEPPMGDYQARCAVLYGSVCAGTDNHLLHQHPPFNAWIKPPFILGHESVGRVTAVGTKVRNLRVGDVVTRVGCPAIGEVAIGWGGFAETAIATDWRAVQEDGATDGFHRSLTVQQVLPADIDPAVGTLFITWRETLSYITRIGVGPNHRVLVIGSGGNGLAFVAHARNLGAAQVTLLGSAGRSAVGKLAGADVYLDYQTKDAWDQAATAVNGGYDFVIDAVGKAEITAKGQSQLRPGGTIGIYGMDEAGLISLKPGKTFTFYGGGYDEGEAHQAVLGHYRSGRLNPAVWTDRSRTFDLDTIAEALAAAATRTLVKPLVRVTADS